MNEMLGWYGYDKINSKDCSLQSMNLVKLREKYRGRSKSTEPETSSDEYNSPQSPTTSSKLYYYIDLFIKLYRFVLLTFIYRHGQIFSQISDIFVKLLKFV